MKVHYMILSLIFCNIYKVVQPLVRHVLFYFFARCKGLPAVEAISQEIFNKILITSG